MKKSLKNFAKSFTHKVMDFEGPVFIEISNKHDISELKNICLENNVEYISDVFEVQLAEYLEVCNLSHGVESEQSLGCLELYDNGGHEDGGEFVYFNWGGRSVVKIVPEDMFYELITWRNKEKITREEQAVIKSKSIAVAGCSVGSFASRVLSKLGFSKLNIAEIKSMKPSNSSRMYQDSLRNYGKHKIIPLVEAIYDYNPFCKINTFMEGVRENNVEDFLKFDGKKVDVFIDAIDDPGAKLLAENYCKKNRIPIVRAFDEKGAIVIIRYDLSLPHPCPFPLSVEDLESIKEIDSSAYLNQLLNFIPGGYEQISERQKQTVQNVLNGTRGGFSQLSWEAALFASSVSKASLDIALGKDINGYKFIDLDEIITEHMSRN